MYTPLCKALKTQVSRNFDKNNSSLTHTKAISTRPDIFVLFWGDWSSHFYMHTESHLYEHKVAIVEQVNIPFNDVVDVLPHVLWENTHS